MLVRSAIILFWVALFFGFLWIPVLVKKITPNTINILSWTELIDREKIDEFERRTGITVNIGYYESNNELLAKLKVTKGVGYDLIIPSDYLVTILVKEQLLQKLDRTKLAFWHRLNPHLLDHYYDPANAYAIPYVWSMYGLGINKHFFDKPVPATWALLFDQLLIKGPIVMLEDAAEVVQLTALYLFGSVGMVTHQELEQVKQTLLAQKKQVIAYTDVGAPYLLLSDQAAIALTSSPYAVRLVKNYPAIDFVVPDQGTFIVIDTIVIPALSTKQDLAYQFINFLYEPEVIRYHMNKTNFLPPTTDVAFADVPVTSREWLCPTAEHFKKFHFFGDTIPLPLVNQLWVGLKSF